MAKASEEDEDAGTARLVARARKEIAEGGAVVPFDVVNRITNGEKPIRAIREFSGNGRR